VQIKINQPISRNLKSYLHAAVDQDGEGIRGVEVLGLLVMAEPDDARVNILFITPS
jgi:hypothetical protein